MRMPLSIFFGLCLVISMAYTAVTAQDVETNGTVCGNPNSPCSNAKWKFKKNDLSFRLPNKLKWQTNYRSAYFYAIMLTSRPAFVDTDVDSNRCSSGYYSEAERLKVQKAFPANKVFASRNGCYGTTGIFYTNVNSTYEFIAVYAGETQQQANTFLKVMRSKGFADANVRRMQVNLGYGD